MDSQSVIWQCAALLVLVGLRSIWVVIYRLFFHPLAKVPGPIFARATFLYATWYNLLGARFISTLSCPIVRITPNEIHLSDPENCEKIYFVGSRYGKDPGFYGAFDTKNLTFSTPSPAIHRIKRAVLNPFFSRKKVLELEEIVQDKVQKLVARMKRAFGSTSSIDLHHGFRAISIDIITDYAFDDCYNFLDKGDFGVGFFNDFREMGPALWFFQQFPELQRIAMGIPHWLAKCISEPLRRKCSRLQILQVKAVVDRGEKASKINIFHQLLQPDVTEGFRDEAQIVLGAAADTTGNALTISAYKVVRNTDIYSRLSAELKDAFPNPEATLDFVTLERLPYLAVVRWTGRLPRVIPASGAEFNGYRVSPGTVVSMSSWIMHHDEGIFPDAETFNPDRWLHESQARVGERYLFSSGKGSRQCVGMQLAYCELYVTLGHVFRQFDNLKTAAKSREELLYDDYFSGYHPEKNNKFVFRQAE
ncbi:cytochrome P450 [Aspergillus crustosus]